MICHYFFQLCDSNVICMASPFSGPFPNFQTVSFEDITPIRVLHWLHYPLLLAPVPMRGSDHLKIIFFIGDRVDFFAAYWVRVRLTFILSGLARVLKLGCVGVDKICSKYCSQYFFRYQSIYAIRLP